MPFFQHQGISFYFEKSGIGPTLLFSHGLGGDWASAKRFLPTLPGWSFVLWDSRGHGRTHPVGDAAAYTFQRFANDLHELAEHLRIGTAVVGGVSMGAAVALRFALDFPQMAAGLIMIRPAWLDTASPEGLQMIEYIGDLVSQHGGDDGLRRFRQTDRYKTLLQNDPDELDCYLKYFSEPLASQKAIRFQRMPRDCPISHRSEAETIQLPTLVIGTNNDQAHPINYAREWQRRIPKAQLETVPSMRIDRLACYSRTQQRVSEYLTSDEVTNSLQRLSKATNSNG